MALITALLAVSITDAQLDLPGAKSGPAPAR